MYTKVIPHKNFRGEVRNQEINFNLTEHEVLKLLVEFRAIFDWQERLGKETDERTLDPAEVIEFYTNFEEILLTAWGVLDESGDHFYKSGRYEFAESSLFHASMKYFLENREEANKMLEDLMPKGMADLVKAADENLVALENSADTSEAMKAELTRLRSQLAAEQNEKPA